MKNEKTLNPVDLDPKHVELIDRYLVEFFRREIYRPLMAELKDYQKIQNSELDLLRAIQSGKINFYRGYFTGKFNAAISKELKKNGAIWTKKNGGSFRLTKPKLSQKVSMAIMTAESSWLKKNDVIQRKLREIGGAEIADKIDLTGIVDKAMFDLDSDMVKSYEGIIVAPKLTEKNLEDIKNNYTQNMQYYIQDFTDKEILSLRSKVKENVFSGQRYEGMVKIIQRSHGVSESKALFLARQETNLLVAKFKESRYNEVGIDEYIWETVVGSPNSPVRPYHARLKGKRCKFSEPPVVNERGDRKNAGEDYGCRCRAKPIVRF